MNRDHVDHVVEQWAVERPDVDASPIRIIGRISRLSRSIDQQLKSVFDEHGLEAWEYDLLAALRRSGPPYELNAGDLLAALMITSGAVTNRIDRLEQRGFVRRSRGVDDRRVVRVRLT
ncbi:MAG: transcriptional regulator, MarR family, partial [Ilumatobacteraceae bacterium]|nr:transcriptional regulator, MarR family [Ilumatobacteraceae bacterium]